MTNAPVNITGGKRDANERDAKLWVVLVLLGDK